MFDYGVDARAVLEAASTTRLALMEHECRLLEIAADWADCHPGDAEAELRPWRLGGEGTPLVDGFCPAELGAVLQTTTGAAAALMADALDLRHRLPRLWRLVRGAGVRSWKARKIAQASRHLSPVAAAAVDAAVAGVVTSVPWARLERMLEAAVMSADPADAEARARAWEAERFVRAGRSVGGLKTLVARARSGEVIWFLAMVNRLAEILALEGDTDSADVRRSRAVGILANPARALQLLADHADDADHPDHAVQTDRSDPRFAGGYGGTEDDGPAISVRPPTVAPRALRPKVTLFVHVSESAVGGSGGVARMEGEGPLTMDQLRGFLGVSDCRITVQPVLDPGAIPAVDRYEVPTAMRTALLLRNPADVFPWGVSTSRTMDADHTTPYLSPAKGGPPGQTNLANLGPLVRFHHRAKTFGRWRLRQPEPGQYLWRSPHGWLFMVNGSGTHDLGNGPLADTIWRAASEEPAVCTPAA